MGWCFGLVLGEKGESEYRNRTHHSSIWRNSEVFTGNGRNAGGWSFTVDDHTCLCLWEPVLKQGQTEN